MYKLVTVIAFFCLFTGALCNGDDKKKDDGGTAVCYACQGQKGTENDKCFDKANIDETTPTKTCGGSPKQKYCFTWESDDGKWLVRGCGQDGKGGKDCTGCDNTFTYSILTLATPGKACCCKGAKCNSASSLTGPTLVITTLIMAALFFRH